ncbi:hypothetical protein Q75_07195 [Bacillus coahuilensis p1.1.43]|uniref:N-acetyltransferase domain-containing protein n=1 Tax=Bacillus coahuilensis p1.1.43 TaxID=1150625 RepID=A0A147K966_9BACI|nr:hypothetical protein [Bacillus coahuilensis]KUP06873.1 hypothetical protein Q75_07195 [Bacillus coahuilensis p1.1.43]
MEDESKTKEELEEELTDLEFQIHRMKENMKEISKSYDIVGIEQTKDNRWVIVYVLDDGNRCKIMLSDCETSYDGTWDFLIQAQYKDDDHIFIGDIKGTPNKGYGTICIPYLKDKARENNVPKIKGDIAKRDWDHVDRLEHFYEKHNFEVSIDTQSMTGNIIWWRNE